MSEQPREPTEEELRAAVEEQMKKVTVEDVLLQTMVSLINLGGRRLTVDDEKNVEQGRQAIEAVRALLPLCPEEEAKPIRDALSQLQMIYVRESKGASPEEGPGPDAEEQAGREKARSKLWTPPGT